MSRSMLAHVSDYEPTIAQRAETLIRRQVDEAINDPAAPVPVVLYGLALTAALTVAHATELLVTRPIVNAIVRATGR